MIELYPIWLSLQLAFFTTIILFIISLPVAAWLSHNKNFLKIIVEVVVSLPLVLPPTVIGFYLLLVFSPASTAGIFLEKHFDVRIVFSFAGLLAGSVIYSLPFMIHPVQSGLASLSASLEEAAYSLGKTKWQAFFKVLLPNCKPSLLTGVILTFAHTMGEFGIVLMIGGNIPGKTRTASVAIYDEVEAFNYAHANVYAFILLGTSFIILLLLYMSQRKLQSKFI